MMVGGVETLRAQVRWLARAIAASMMLMFLAVALPWLVRMIEIELAPLAWTMTAFAATHVALILASDRVQREAVMLRLLYAVPILGVGFMALLWHRGGGIGHPSLAMAMVLPVMAAAALPRARFAFDVAIYSIVAVTITVTITSPDFGWYVTQLGIPGAALVRLAGEELVTRDPFPGATTTPAAAFLFVLTFALVQLAAAFVATRVARFVRMREELAQRLTDPVADTLPSVAMDATPVIGVLVIAATGQIVQATKRFAQQMLLHNDPIVGRELFDILRFDHADRVRTLLASGGAIASCRYRVGPEARTATITATTFEHERVTYASVVIDEDDEEQA
jgi:hypothetical protein